MDIRNRNLSHRKWRLRIVNIPEICPDIDSTVAYSYFDVSTYKQARNMANYKIASRNRESRTMALAAHRHYLIGGQSTVVLP